MTRKLERTLGLTLLLGMLATPLAVAGNDHFTLMRGIPADAMIAAHTRTHDGMQFVTEQYERVWKAIEKQQFDKDLRRLIRDAIKEGGGDVAAFDEQWRQITDLAAGVHWQTLAQREFAVAVKIATPFGGEFAYLMQPPADRVAEDFSGLTAMLTNLVALAPPDVFTVTIDGEGGQVAHIVSLAEPVVPMKMILARHDDTLMLGFGSTLPDQVLALLRGETAEAAGATLGSTPRFQKAFQGLPAAKDAMYFIDVAALMEVSQTFAQMGAAVAASEMPGGAEGEQAAAPSFDFLPKIVAALDIWEYVAGVTSTDGMRTVTEEVVLLRDNAKSRPLYRIAYGGGPLDSPLKYVPKEATEVSVSSGPDLVAFYDELIKFIKNEVPDGEMLLTQWEAVQQEVGFDAREQVFSWLGSKYVSFSAPIPTPFLPSWVVAVEVRDPEKAQAALERLSTFLDGALAQQNGGVEDADVEGFKRVILPAFLAMVPGLGAPHYGMREGHLFLCNNREILETALATGAGERPNFLENERYQQEGLPLSGKVVAFSFTDLSKLGEQLGQTLPMIGAMAGFMPEVQKNPVARTLLGLLVKVGNVCKELNFFKSSCSVTTFDGQRGHMKSVTNYKEPPKPKTGTTIGAP